MGVQIFFLTLLVLWTVVANGLVFVVLYKFPKLRSLPNLLVGNLAFADFCLGLVVLPLSVTYSVLDRWTLGQFLCEFWLACDILLCTASIWNLAMIGFDRYFALTKPVEYIERRTTKLAIILIVVVWVFSACVCVAPFFGWRHKSALGNHVMRNNTTGVYSCVHFEDLPSYTIYSATGSFIIPLLLMFFVYINIFCAFKKHKRRQIYRQKVIRKHLESTILQDLSHVLPTSDEFARSDDDDDDDDLDSASKETESRDVNVMTRDNATDRDASDAIAPLPEQHLTFTIALDRRVRTGRSFKRVGSRRRVNRTQLTYERVVRHKRRKDLKLRTSLMTKPKAISAAKEKRGVKVLGIILGCFAVCWTPFFVMYVTLTFCKTCYISKHLEALLTWLGYANSGINPIIYTVFSRDFQNAVKKLLSRTTKSSKPGSKPA